MAVYLNQYQHIPYERSCEALSDLFNCPMSQGTLKNILAECHSKLEGAEDAIKKQIISSNVAHFDETGLRVTGKTSWIHSASTETATHYHVHAKRGAEATISAGILPNFTGTAIHDGWKPYMSFECGRGLCNAHHLRELIFIEEQYKQEWAKKMGELLQEINITVCKAKEAEAVTLTPDILKKFMLRYERIIRDAYTENPSICHFT